MYGSDLIRTPKTLRTELTEKTNGPHTRLLAGRYTDRIDLNSIVKALKQN